jgi:hypothetical protein
MAGPREMALEEELHLALRLLVSTLTGERQPEETAYLICANFPNFLVQFEHRDFLAQGQLETIKAMARDHGPPPCGTTWENWFGRQKMLWGKSRQHKRLEIG